MFVRDYPNKNRGLLGSIKWLAFCYIIRYRSQNSFDEVGGEGGFFLAQLSEFAPRQTATCGPKVGMARLFTFLKN